MYLFCNTIVYDMTMLLYGISRDKEILHRIPKLNSSVDSDFHYLNKRLKTSESIFVNYYDHSGQNDKMFQKLVSTPAKIYKIKKIFCNNLCPNSLVFLQTEEATFVCKCNLHKINHNNCENIVYCDL